MGGLIEFHTDKERDYKSFMGVERCFMGIKSSVLFSKYECVEK
jgi:hypothetical protein